jgi:ribonuclease Y
VRAAGKSAAEMLKVEKMHPEILHLVGKLLYRTSYTQNQWAHAIESAYLCGMIAEDLGVDAVAARRSALIHDIGKVLWAETEAVGSHAVSGAAFARAHGEPPEIVHPIAAHHNDEKPDSVLAYIVAAADALSGARPGARRATEEAYSMRVEDLERICQSFRGIESHFVIQGGRELRIVVDQGRRQRSGRRPSLRRGRHPHRGRADLPGADQSHRDPRDAGDGGGPILTRDGSAGTLGRFRFVIC